MGFFPLCRVLTAKEEQHTAGITKTVPQTTSMTSGCQVPKHSQLLDTATCTIRGSRTETPPPWTPSKQCTHKSAGLKTNKEIYQDAFTIPKHMKAETYMNNGRFFNKGSEVKCHLRDLENCGKFPYDSLDYDSLMPMVS